MAATLVVRLSLIISDILVLYVSYRETVGLWDLRNVAASTNKVTVASLIVINGEDGD